MRVGLHRARQVAGRELGLGVGVHEAHVGLPDEGLRLVGALFLQTREIARRDVAGNVAAGEARVDEFLDVRVVVQARAHQVVEILINEAVGADQLRHFFIGAVGGNQL